MLHIPNSAEGNCLTEKENHTLCLTCGKTLADRFASCENTEVASPPPPDSCLANKKNPYTPTLCTSWIFSRKLTKLVPFSDRCFRGVYSEILALFQACVGPISTLHRRGKLLELYLDSSYVTLNILLS